MDRFAKQLFIAVIFCFYALALSETMAQDPVGSDSYFSEDLAPSWTTPAVDVREEWQSPGFISVFTGIEGSKQPQDFGVNANLGVRGAISIGSPLFPKYGIGVQAGTAIVGSGNAVQVFELLGESTERWQSFNTIGLFQRLPSGFSWGFAYDYVHQDSYDSFDLGQWRIRASQVLGETLEVGATVSVSDRSDNGRFNTTEVELTPMQVFQVYLRKYWETGSYTTAWIGLSDGHSEENVVTGGLPAKNDTPLFGADFFAPLNSHLAIYGEANLIFPSDTGAVDAFLGFEFTPFSTTYGKSSNRYRPFIPLAGSTTFTTNLSRR